MHSIIKNYINDSPPEHQIRLRYLSETIETHITDYEIMNPNSFPVYTKDNTWVTGFASRNKGVMFYLMDQKILDKYENRLGKLRTGKSCIEYKESKNISLEELNKLIVKMLKEAEKIVRR